MLTRMHTWFSIGGSVRGAAHLKQDKPCQDALRIYNDPENRYSLACLADGHGSNHCPYSDEGALAAVQTAETLLRNILDEQTADEAFRTLDSNKEIWLPKQIETQWKRRVRELHAQRESHTQQEPLTQQEPHAQQEPHRQQESHTQPVWQEPFSYALYGTTLAVLAVTETFAFAIQIGDGDILMIDGDASVRWLIPPEYAPGNETYSLCMDHCWQHIRSRMVPLDADNTDALMFLLSTDGYANSFAEQQGFIKAGADIFKLWRDNGTAYLEAHLLHWLTHSSADGSGDDITLALALRVANA